MQTRQLQEPCATGCRFVATERNRYFTGKYMAARDFRDEQVYFLSHHWLHNRLLHGWGIVCGLRVIHHPNPDCEDRWVVVRAGIAIDCCGRELILPEDTCFELPLPRPETGAEEPVEADENALAGPFLLCLCYVEEEIEPVPALYAEGTCDPTRQEANRVREVACLEVRGLDQVEADCWRVPGGEPSARCRDDCDHTLPGPAGICLEPECPCGECVPLARIDFDPANIEAGFEIDTQGRRHLSVPPEFLTHIAGINWPHGGELSLSDLQDMNGRLEMRFDRPLQPSTSDGLGINEYTMTVQYAEAQQQLEFLPYDLGNRPKLENNCLAVYTMDLEDIPRSIIGSNVYITLYCDFVPDCHGNPVDGDHRWGRLPSGNGLPGGVFRSWFRIVDGDLTSTIGLSISGPASAERGQPVTLNLTVTNKGSADLHDVRLVDRDRDVIEQDLDLPAGDRSHEVAYDVEIPPEATNPFVVRIQASGEYDNRRRTFDTSQHTIRLKEAPSTISVTKVLKEENPPGELGYEITIQNHSTEPLTDVILVDRYLVQGGTVQDIHSQPGGVDDESRRRVTWTWNKLEPGQAVPVTMTMEVSPHASKATVKNWAKVSATAPNGQRIRNSAELETFVQQ